MQLFFILILLDEITGSKVTVFELTYVDLLCSVNTDSFAVKLSGFVMLTDLPIVFLLIDRVFASESK